MLPRTPGTILNKDEGGRMKAIETTGPDLDLGVNSPISSLSSRLTGLLVSDVSPHDPELPQA